MAIRYRAIAENQDYVAANQRLLQVSGQLKRHDLNLADNDQALREFAQTKAEQCRSFCNESSSKTIAVNRCMRLLENYRLATEELTSAKNIDAELARFRDHRWWIRRICP